MCMSIVSLLLKKKNLGMIKSKSMLNVIFDLVIWLCRLVYMSQLNTKIISEKEKWGVFFPGFPQSWKVRESHGKISGHGKSWKSHGK